MSTKKDSRRKENGTTGPTQRHFNANKQQNAMKSTKNSSLADKNASSQCANPKINDVVVTTMNNATTKTTPTKTNRNQVSANWNSVVGSLRSDRPVTATVKKRGFLSKHSPIALDCEMVGVGPNGRDHMLARVSIVNEKGEIVMDKYVKPTEPVIDYRTRFSGITPKHLENAYNFTDVQAEVSRIKLNRILVGHAVHNDLKVLKMHHPKALVRDTSTYRHCREYSEGRNPSLRLLANCILKYDIQTGAHCSVEDAQAAMSIYKRFARNWERSMEKHL